MAKFLYYTTEQMIRFFLEQGKEGDFWDFKEEWHSDKNDLIKDIICFANTIHDETCYIVFGITDDLQVVGIKNSKYQQSDILDMISQLMFAGDVYPKIELESIVFDGKKLDILKILNEDKTPIYLKKAYGNMNANCIYMRLGDKNTPDKSNAHITDIELLWKKRLGLLKTPRDYIYDRLDNKLEWVHYDDVFHNIYKPEYTLEIVDDDKGRIPMFYAYSVTNESCKYEILSMKYHTTLLEEFQLVVLDGGRLEVTTPAWGYIYCDEDKLHSKYEYKYYIIGSPNERILRFLYDPENPEERYAFHKFRKVVLFYKSAQEKEKFELFLNENLDLVDSKLKECNEYNYVNTGNVKETKIIKEQLRIGLILNQLLEEWRKDS